MNLFNIRCSAHNYTFFNKCCELLNHEKADDKQIKRHDEEINTERTKQMSKKPNSFRDK